MRIVFIGNCHASILSRVLTYLTEGSVICQAVQLHQKISDSDRYAVANADVVVNQTRDFERADTLLSELSAKIIPFPLLEFQLLWPFNTKAHPRAKEHAAPWCLEGIFPWPAVDMQLVRLIEERNLSIDAPEENVDCVIAEYLDLDYAKLASLDRLLELTRSKQQKAARIVGYDIWKYLEKNFRSVSVFASSLHPENNTLKGLCQAVFSTLNYDYTEAQIDNAFDEIYDGDNVFPRMIPIHPSVLRHFEIEWPGNPARYRAWYQNEISIESYSKGICRFDPRERARELFGRINNGQANEALEAQLASLVVEESTNPILRCHYGDYLIRFGRHADALVHYLEAATLAPGNKAITRRLVRALHRHGLPAPPLLQTTEDLSTGLNCPGVIYLAENWHHPNGWGTWTSGGDATLHFAIAGTDHRRDGFVFKCDATAFGVPQGRDVTVNVRINGVPTAQWLFNKANPPGLRSLVVEAALADNGNFTVRFLVDRPASPVDINESHDRRVFGLGLKSFSVTALSVTAADRTAQVYHTSYTTS